MNFAILGAGKIATTMAITLQPMKGVTCYAVAARDMERAQIFADKYGFARAYGSYLDMLNDENVELVYIATPHSHHYEHIKMCLEHGKHVLCEKAFTANARQAEEVLRMAEDRGLLLTEAIWTRYMPMRQTINEVLKSGLIGKPTSLSANLGYPLEHVERMVKPELAGGALLDLGVYVLNFASMVFGDEIESISASCIKLPSGVDGQETIMLSYQDGKMATLYATMLAQTDRRGMINGTNGYIEIENINNYESIRVYNLERRLIAEYAAPYQITGYEYEVQSAMKAIREGMIECPEMPHIETLRMMQLMDSIREAWEIEFPFERMPMLSPTDIVAATEKPSRESSVNEISNSAANDKISSEDEALEGEVSEGDSSEDKVVEDERAEKEDNKKSLAFDDEASAEAKAASLKDLDSETKAAALKASDSEASGSKAAAPRSKENGNIDNNASDDVSRGIKTPVFVRKPSESESGKSKSIDDMIMRAFKEAHDEDKK